VKRRILIWASVIIILVTVIVLAVPALATTPTVTAWVKGNGDVKIATVDGNSYQTTNPDPGHPDNWVLESWNIQGVQGEQGEKGDTGDTGADGIDGTNGVDGTNGIDGTNGEDGADGANGVDGIDGTNGADGIDGTNGADGTNGTNGVDGIDGADGAKGDNGEPMDYRAGTATITRSDKPCGIAVVFSSELPDANYSVSFCISGGGYPASTINRLMVVGKTAEGFFIASTLNPSKTKTIVVDWIAVASK